MEDEVIYDACWKNKCFRIEKEKDEIIVSIIECQDGEYGIYCDAKNEITMNLSERQLKLLYWSLKKYLEKMEKKKDERRVFEIRYDPNIGVSE